MKFRKTGKIIASLMLICLLIPLTTAYGAEPITNPTQTGHTPSGIPFSELESRIDELIAEHLGVSTPGVAIVVVSEGEVIFLRGYGYADTQNSILVDPETTVFRHGSINKVFVWLSVMQLVEQGLIDLDVDIATYLPSSFLGQVNFTQVFTMRDLMNHTAGFEEVMLDIMFDLPGVQTHRTLKEALIIAQPRQIYEVGTISGYSNWGSALAAFVVEQISGVSYHVFERENILRPLGMYNTLNQPDWIGNHGFLQNVAQGYSRVGGGRFNTTVTPYITIYPAGSSLGTVSDMAYFLKYLTPSTEEAAHPFYGFMSLAGVVPNFGHGGGTPASTTLFAVEPVSRFGYAVFTNVGQEIPIQLGIHDLLIGNATSQVPTNPSGLPSTEAVAGNFVLGNRFGGFAEFANYLSMVRITAIDDDAIELRFGNATATYRQVEPYLFHKISIDGHHPHLSLLWAQIYFNIVDGRLTHGSTSGGGFDLVAVERTTPFLLANAIFAVAAILFFLITPIVLLLRFIIRRRKGITSTGFSLAVGGLLTTGALVAINNIVWFLRVTAVNFMGSASDFAFHVLINYALVGLSVVMLVLAAFFLNKDKAEVKTKSKVFFGVTAVLSVFFALVLQYWNFFVIL